jgi:hypothetical protein
MDSADTPEQQAYRRGDAAGYSVGLIDGWDACMRHVQDAFDKAIEATVTEPEAVRKHREVVLDAQRGPGDGQGADRIVHFEVA